MAEQELNTHHADSANGRSSARRPSILHPDLQIRSKDEMPDPHELGLEEELDGWHGYIEWERYPERKQKAKEFLKKFKFPSAPEFQLVPLPKTNPVLEGVRWKQYHYALGRKTKDMPAESWLFVEKEKSPDMIHVLQFPYNGEPPRNRLVESAITSNEDHFVRNHGGIPEIDEDAYFFVVGGLVNNPKRITLKDLKNETIFPRQSNVVTIQCSGTRRIEQINQYPGDGDELINAPWGEGAIGTARWTGVSLKKVIKYCGGLKDPSGANHVEFLGADTYFKKGEVFNYAVSVPWRKVKVNEVLLAWEMNGKPLPKIHGFPLRAVVFGYIGARSCKWLTRINVLPHESPAPVQKKEYLYYNSQVGKHNATYSSGFSIQDMPVSSAIMSPIDMDQIVHEGKIKLKGWAYSGGGHWPVRVEVSGDGGSIWYEVPYENLSEKYYYAWRLWEIDLPVDAEGWLELMVRCWDNSMNTQPTFVRSTWNWDLHVTSSCHRIKVFSINKSRPKTAAPPIEQHLVLGISLGGHAAWQVLFADPRVTAGIVIIGCPDYMHMMSDRARLSKLQTYTSTQGATFPGSKDFPPALLASLRKWDPKGILFGSTEIDLAPNQALYKPLLDQKLKGKRILVCSGADDKLVPYRCSEPFTRFLKNAAAGWYQEGELYVEDNVYPGVGHAFSDGMLDDTVRFVNETLAGTLVGDSVGQAKI